MKMIADVVAITTGNRNTIATCETKNLDAQIAALGARKPAMADRVEQLRKLMKEQ